MNESGGSKRKLTGTLVIVGALLALVVCLLGLVVFLVTGGPLWLPPIVGILFGWAMVWHLYRSAHLRATRGFEPVKAGDEAQARFENLAQGLSLSIGLAQPELLVVRDDAMNAMAADGGSQKTVVITDTLLDQLERIELEGVLAELLVRLKNGDARESTVLASVVGGPLIDAPLGKLTKPIGSWLLNRHFDEHRDMLADQRAVAVTRYPPGLSAAFSQMTAGSVTPKAATVGSDHLWLATPPRPESVVPSIPLDWRIEVLTEI